ncbi:MAG: B12-binding domain-containing radical SAM protein, partial [Bacteroidota bacterium]
MIKTLFITPPFTQLNTPYPATAYLKGFFNTFAWPSEQMDLGIEVILQVFSKEGLKKIFAAAESYEVEISENAYRIYQIRAAYLRTIDPAIQFLQNRNPTLAHIICDRNYLPEASRFAQIEDLDWAFGSMGIQDRARHLVTLYLEDLGDFIKEVIDPHFGFSRYAERLSSSATHFDPILDELEQEDSLIMEWMKAILARKVAAYQPDLLCLSVPFPGNLFAALKCGQWVKQQHPTTIKVVLGGGYANTELRSLGEERLFDFIDFVSLDDGEAPLQCLMEYLNGQRAQKDLKRIFYRQSGVVQYSNGAVEKDVPQRETGTPDYSGLLLKDYLSVIELANPMHRLWSDGRWNKLTLAHGCYWGKCSFCDVSLDYIKRYEPLTASLLCDRIESIIEQTGENGFHFVDEAAPPALMRDLALEIIRRQLTVVWWTNIRFEKNFTADLCRLLKASGCTAVSGGLEVASDRLLESMKKGVTVAQVARVANHFTEAGIMVHAYLMYGFPTQTDQETIDSLEMVRQLFEYGALQSGFWHQFAMTAHSPVGLDPQAYGVAMLGPEQGTFANNDLIHEDVEGADHLRYAEGLKKSLFNYMHGLCFEDDLGKWFDFGVPTTSIPSDYIEEAIEAIEA